MIYGFASPTECLAPRIRIELQNISTFQLMKRQPSGHTNSLLLIELGMRAYQFLDEVPDPADAECEHGRLLTDDCDECERY